MKKITRRAFSVLLLALAIILGMTVFNAAFLIAMVFIVDLFYCLIDPRIKYD